MVPGSILGKNTYYFYWGLRDFPQYGREVIGIVF